MCKLISLENKGRKRKTNEKNLVLYLLFQKRKSHSVKLDSELSLIGIQIEYLSNVLHDKRAFLDEFSSSQSPSLS
jgi:hypothetical protein